MPRRDDGIYQRRGRTWYLDFIHDGQRHVARLGKGISRTVARELATVKRGQILKGEAGIGPKRKDITFEKAAEEFLGWVRANKRPKTAASYAECLKQLSRSFGGKRLSEIHPFLVEKHKQARSEAGARIAANRELSALKAMVNRCIAWKKFDGVNPVIGVKPFKEQGRVRYLEPEEEARLLAECREPLHTLVLVGIYAGLRVKSEALTLQTSDVNLGRGSLTVQAAYAKSGQTRTVPINSVLRAALQRLASRNGHNPYIFHKEDGAPYRSIKSAFGDACKRAGLIGVTPHTLRHTFGSRLAMAGVDLRTIQELGGWSSLKMVERYSHLSPKHKADAVERIAVSFPGLPANSPSLATTAPPRALAVVG